MHDNAQQSKRWPLNVTTTTWLIFFGFTQALSLAWPFEGDFKGVPQGWLQCVSLAVLAGLLDRSQSGKQAFATGWTFSLAWLIGSTWWLFISMNRYGGLSVPVAAIAVFALSAGLALFYGMASAAFYAICQTSVGVFPRACAFAAVWALAEMARGTLWTGFPWGAVGYAHVDSLLQHWAPWVGVYGLCALSAFLAMAVAAERRGYRSTSRATLVSITLGVTVLGFTWLTSPGRHTENEQRSAHSLRVTLLQGNIPQDLKFAEGVNQALHDYRDALLTGGSDLIVTPETAIPLIPERMPEHYWAQLQTHFSKGSQAALIGLPLVRRNEEGQLQYSNSVLGLMPQVTPASTATYQYDKHHLVPFGEFVPPLFQWFVQLLNIPLGDFTRGDVVQPNFIFKGERIAPNICYEDLFGEEMARSFADHDQAPTLMVNLSNIAWFGNTVAIDQHLHISRMRALELGRPMLRATNTGATAIINAQGQVTHRLPSAVQGALTADVYGVHGSITPYARWVSVWGLWPLAMLALLTLLIVAGMAHASRHGQRRFGP
ncbi:apolipoprotein N-acyltransferase [Limnohabitans sp.]|uniref:apolipoprotein N-acyltransferase n=1 Tax=Limnohabitans sp. TaxID=1907725 RepID=UPI00286F91D8|nr:apolipoprotein N-acyltransferase [Limnohabitans sp.]